MQSHQLLQARKWVQVQTQRTPRAKGPPPRGWHLKCRPLTCRFLAYLHNIIFACLPRGMTQPMRTLECIQLSETWRICLRSIACSHLTMLHASVLHQCFVVACQQLPTAVLCTLEVSHLLANGADCMAECISKLCQIHSTALSLWSCSRGQLTASCVSGIHVDPTYGPPGSPADGAPEQCIHHRPGHRCNCHHTI